MFPLESYGGIAEPSDMFPVGAREGVIRSSLLETWRPMILLHLSLLGIAATAFAVWARQVSLAAAADAALAESEAQALSNGNAGERLDPLNALDVEAYMGLHDRLAAAHGRTVCKDCGEVFDTVRLDYQPTACCIFCESGRIAPVKLGGAK